MCSVIWRNWRRGEPPIDEFRTLTAEEQVEEFFFLGLRQVEGVDLDLARERWGADYLKRWEDKIQNLAHEGWVVSARGSRAHGSPRLPDLQ